MEAFIGDLRHRRVLPHIAIHGGKTQTGRTRRTAIDGRTNRHGTRDQPPYPQEAEAASG